MNQGNRYSFQDIRKLRRDVKNRLHEEVNNIEETYQEFGEQVLHEMLLTEEDDSHRPTEEDAEKIIDGIRKGLTQEEIGKRLDVSARTVRNYQTNILRGELGEEYVKKIQSARQERATSKSGSGSSGGGSSFQTSGSKDQLFRGNNQTTANVDRIEKVFPGEFYDDHSRIPPQAHNIIDRIIGRKEKVPYEKNAPKVAGIQFPAVFLFGYKMSGTGLFYELWFDTFNDIFEIYNRHGAKVNKGRAENINDAIKIFTEMIVKQERLSDSEKEELSRKANQVHSNMRKSAQDSVQSAVQTSQQQKKDTKDLYDQYLRKFEKRLTEPNNINELQRVWSSIEAEIGNIDDLSKRDILKLKEVLKNVRKTREKQLSQKETEEEKPEESKVVKDYRETKNKIENAETVDEARELFNNYVDRWKNYTRYAQIDDLEKVVTKRYNEEFGKDNGNKTISQNDMDKVKGEREEKQKVTRERIQRAYDKAVNRINETDSFNEMDKIYKQFVNNWKLLADQVNFDFEDDLYRTIIKRMQNIINEDLEEYKEIIRNSRDPKNIKKQYQEFVNKWTQNEVAVDYLNNYIKAFIEELQETLQKRNTELSNVSKMQRKSSKQEEGEEDYSKVVSGQQEESSQKIPASFEYKLYEQSSAKTIQDIHHLVAYDLVQIYENESRASKQKLNVLKKYWWRLKNKAGIGEVSLRDFIIPRKNLKGGVIQHGVGAARQIDFKGYKTTAFFVRGYSLQDQVNLEIWEVVYEPSFAKKLFGSNDKTTTFWVFNVTSASVVESNLPTLASAEHSVARKIVVYTRTREFDDKNRDDEGNEKRRSLGMLPSKRREENPEKTREKLANQDIESQLDN